VENIENNVKIITNKSDKNGNLFISIDVENPSFDSFKLLQIDLEILTKKWKLISNESNHPLYSVYADLLNKISNNLFEKLTTE
jgi:hypothetical protein